MCRLLKVLVGVLTGRRIATADVSAAQAFAQLHPTLTRLETFFTALAARRDTGIGLLYVLTLHRHESSSKRYLSWMNRREGQIPTIQRAGSRQLWLQELNAIKTGIACNKWGIGWAKRCGRVAWAKAKQFSER
jgi:hypothetical protein